MEKIQFSATLSFIEKWKAMLDKPQYAGAIFAATCNASSFAKKKKQIILKHYFTWKRIKANKDSAVVQNYILVYGSEQGRPEAWLGLYQIPISRGFLWKYFTVTSRQALFAKNLIMDVWKVLTTSLPLLCNKVTTCSFYFLL